MIGQTLEGQRGHRFTIIREIGRGGFGVVYLAEDETKTQYAVKIIAPVSNPDARLSYQQEVQSTVGLENKNLLRIVDYGECLVGSTRGLFAAAEFCPDGDYRNVLTSFAERKPSIQEILGHVKQILEGLKALHTRTIHRDLKPENVFLAGDTLKIGDFGLAKFVDEATRTLTFKGSGTPRYMAPEVWTGQHVSPATDLYALGILFFEAVTGQPPFAAPDNQGLRDMHLYTPVPRPKTLNPALPDTLDGLIKKLVAKSMRDRYQNANEVLLALEAVPKAADSAVVGLADRVRRHHDTAEAKALEEQRAIQLEQNSQKRIQYMEQQLLDLIQEVVDELNSQLVETKIIRQDGYGGGVYRFQDRVLAVEFFRAGELYHNPDIPGLMDTLRKKNAIHGGIIEIREHGEDHEGWNVVLVRPESDLYGEWRLVESKLSALSRRASKFEPLATNAQALATNLGYHWMNTMHTFQLNDKPLEKSDVLKIIGVFIPK
jgi:eukaryotic-like serine/threonine-protein kinase